MSAASTTEVDVLIIGAGLSGIGAAARLNREHPQRSYLVLESRAASGGTWDLFRYPGIRSDSDMFTLGYDFKPWTDDQALAAGGRILEYVRETAHEYGVDRHIRYGQAVQRADWDSETARWTVHTEDAVYVAAFLWACTGYYDYENPYQPQIPGQERFAGPWVHPQLWPEGLDYQGRSVVVIGSGATAVSLVPALARGGAARVTMLQRSPTYILSLPGRDPLATRLSRWLSPMRSYRAVRWKSAKAASILYRLSRSRPAMIRRLVRSTNAKALPEGYPVDVHFNPRYQPWDERMCYVPDSDLFEEISAGRVEMVTDTIEEVEESGMRLTSGRHLDADIVVAATGLNLRFLGGVTVTVDGEKLDLSQAMTYRAMMLAGLPNMAFTIGYTNATWTLKADLVADFVCRLLRRMDEQGARSVVPVRPEGIEERPLMDFTPGYVRRALDRLPHQGDREPWRLRQSYSYDRKVLRRPIDDPALHFS